MAFIYEVNGQKVEFEKEPTDKDIDEAARSLKAAPVSQQQKPVEGSGGAAFGVFRPQGRRPESQQDREASKEMPLQTARGVVTGTLGAPADILNLPGALYGAATNQPAPYRIPLGSEEFNQMLPGQSDTPQAKLARLGGEILAPIPTIKGAKAIAQVPGQVYQTGKEFTQGAMEGLRNPVYQRNSQTAFAPLQETYYPTPQVQAFQNAPVADRPGMLPKLEASQQPSSSLFNSPTELLASALGPKTKQGQNLIPYQGETTRAFGETVGRDIATEPFKTTGLPSIAGATIGGLVGGPFGAMAGAGLGAAINPLLRGAELYSLNKLGKTAGFTRGFPEQLAQAQGRAGIQAQAPQTPLLTNNPTAPGPVNPQTMYVAPEGVAGTNINQVSQMGAQQKYAPQPIAQTPAQQSQQMAAQKLQEVQQKPTVSPQQQAILDQIRARKNQPAPAPATPAPAQTGSMFESLPGQRWTPAEKLALERANLQNNPPPAMSMADEASMAKQAAESTKANNDAIINDFATQGNSNKIDMISQTIPVDMGKDAFNASNATRGMAKNLLKNGIDSIPVLPGMTEAQTVHAINDAMKGSKTKTAFTPEARTSKTNKSAPKNVNQMLIDDTPSENPDLFFSKLGQDRYKQLGPWKNEYNGVNLGNETQATRTVMDKDGTVVTQAFDSEFGMARFEGKNKNGDTWMTEYEGSSNFGGRNAKVNSVPEYSDDLSILNPNNITRQTVTYKDGRTFERSSLLDEPELTYSNPNTGNHIDFDEDGNVIKSIKIGKKEATLSDGSKIMDDDYDNITDVPPEVDKFPNLENIIDNFEFPSKKDLGQEVKLPEKKAFDPNDPKQSFEMLTEMSPTEKRYREMSKSELKVKKQLLELDIAKAKYQGDKDLLNNALEIVNRLLK